MDHISTNFEGHSQGRLFLSTNGATKPCPFWGYFSIKNFILKNRRLQPFYSFIFKDVSAV